MVLIKEFRIPLPMTVEEFQIAQLYMVAEASKEATEGQTAIEILINEPYEDPIMGKGQYTHKIYHIAGRCPKIIQAVAPVSALKIDERAWNAYPYCKTVYTNQFLGERFNLTVESMHIADDGSTSNALNTDQTTLSKRKIQYLDIYSPNDPSTKDDPSLDTTNISSQKAKRGPLKEGWEKTSSPLMCCYKLVTTKFKIFGLETKVESMIDQVQRDIFMKFFKQLYCHMDNWIDLSMEEIREKEAKTKEELDKKIAGLNLETRESSSLKFGHEEMNSDPLSKAIPPNAVDEGNQHHESST